MAPLVHKLKAEEEMQPVVVVTGQHREMLDQVLEVFGIVPDVDLDLLQPGQSLSDVTVAGLKGLGPVLDTWRPHVMVVQGDTTTTFAAALASYYSRVPVAHLEAGLRTGNRWSPYPEEINRRLTTQLASLHLAPTRRAEAALLAEGVQQRDIVVTGNTVIDALLWTKQRWDKPTDPIVIEAQRHDGPVLVVTAHRRESWGEALHEVGLAVADVAQARRDVLVVLPVHRNPIVRRWLLPPLEGLTNVVVVEPLAYVPFVQLMANATLVLTDSGGVQEEAPSLGKPVLVMRDTTERPEGIEAGSAKLVGTTREGVRAGVLALLSDEEAYSAMAKAVNPYGDGHAADRVVEALRSFLALETNADRTCRP